MNLTSWSGETPEMICFNLAGIVASCHIFQKFDDDEHRFLWTVR